MQAKMAATCAGKLKNNFRRNFLNHRRPALG
jgi:hypothetical protein